MTKNKMYETILPGDERRKDFGLALNKMRPQIFPGKHSALDDILNGLRGLIILAGDDADREGVLETPKRFAKAFLEMTSGYQENPKDHLAKNFSIQDVDEDDVPFYDEMVISGGIPFSSLCEHHLLSFSGRIYIGYIPNPDTRRIVGLSKLARCADGYARRLQVQERLTVQIEQAITGVLAPLGTAVVIRAQHSCQCNRGVRKDGFMVTSRMTGVFRDKPEVRAEFMSLCDLTGGNK